MTLEKILTHATSFTADNEQLSTTSLRQKNILILRSLIKGRRLRCSYVFCQHNTGESFEGIMPEQKIRTIINNLLCDYESMIFHCNKQNNITVYLIVRDLDLICHYTLTIYVKGEEKK